MIPIVAVAQEHSIYYFKDYAPYMRFDLPLIKFSESEQAIWTQMKDFAPDDDASFIDATERLFAIREGGTQVSALTSELISFEDINQQKAFFNLKRNAALIHKNFITCLGKINKSLDEEKCPQMLIVGTEHQ